MKLIDIFEQLSHGELSTVAIGGMNQGFGIREEDYEKIISHVNLGIADLCKKFELFTVETEVEQVEGEHIYTLGTDLLNIVSIMDQDKFTYSLNRLNVIDPTYNVRTLPSGFEYKHGELGNTFTVVYRALYPNINPIGLVPEETEIDLNPGIMQPLLYFIASRVYANLPILEGVNKSMEYFLKYNEACALIEKNGFIHNLEFENTKLTDNGWV